MPILILLAVLALIPAAFRGLWFMVKIVCLMCVIGLAISVAYGP